ncbi:hypothetical protein QU661_06615 [Mogibacterium neglectum]|uniref:hypothetical protein n=1 Tax=Mogibacterium neglectum TaxID=114528 RepID=UPI00272C12FE|nr:hypothetical protein [Mogibacterium neglectum]WLD75948.1 hypothetical protein QU661_06615 [Mogibacterium neglectum]
MSSNTKRRYRKPLSFTFIFVGILLLIFAILQIASKPTADKDRVVNNKDIKVLVETADNSRSAIVKTYELDKFSKLSKSKQMKIISSTCGKVEGDTPNVSLKSKDTSYIKIHFQDKKSKAKTPEIDSITLYTAAGMPVNPKKRQDIGVLYNYDYKTDELSMYLSEFIPADKLVFSDSKSNSTNDNNDSNGDVANEEYDIWFCIFEIKYSIGSKKYLTYTAVSVGE